MRIVGRDYIFKLQGLDFLESVFEERKRYFTAGEPQELSRGSLAYFVLKKSKNDEYRLVGEARVLDAGRMLPSDRHYRFATDHGWKFAIELGDLKRYPQDLSPTDAFGADVIKKIHQERPFGIDLQPTQSRFAREKITQFLGSVQNVS